MIIKFILKTESWDKVEMDNGRLLLIKKSKDVNEYVCVCVTFKLRVSCRTESQAYENAKNIRRFKMLPGDSNILPNTNKKNKKIASNNYRKKKKKKRETPH